VRVLDLTHWLGRYATRLFADLGAEVVRVEPQSGLPDRVTSGEAAPYAFAFFNASKKSVSLDLERQEGRDAFARLASEAQIVMLESGGPLADELAWVRSLNPQAVITHLSPYGLGSDARATDLTLQAAGGIAWLSGRPGQPPLRLPLDQSVMITSVYAAVATALCLLDAETTGTGHLVDVSAQECIAHSLQNALEVFNLEGRISCRGGEGTRDATEDIFACKDGAVFLAAPPPLGVSWPSLLAWMQEEGHPAFAALSAPDWSDRAYRNTAAAKAVFRQEFEAFIRDRTKAALTAEALRRKIVMAPVARIAEVLGDEQLAYRNYFATVDDPQLGRGTLLPGAPYRLSEPVWHASAAPGLGQHNDELLAAMATP
jgi:benzylsuccinate CoA-transferase BbsE subunit